MSKVSVVSKESVSVNDVIAFQYKDDRKFRLGKVDAVNDVYVTIFDLNTDDKPGYRQFVWNQVNSLQKIEVTDAPYIAVSVFKPFPPNPLKTFVIDTVKV